MATHAGLTTTWGDTAVVFPCAKDAGAKDAGTTKDTTDGFVLVDGTITLRHCRERGC